MTSAATGGGGRGLDPYDAVLLVSFGGPERPEDVLPFLANVTRGRGVPAERLVEVAEHYQHFGGRSPINDQCRALLAALRTELDRRGIGVPLFWGNRNWQPYLADTMAELIAGGHRRLLARVLFLPPVSGRPLRRRRRPPDRARSDQALRDPSRLRRRLR
jgi:protoheme ferro-lyase